MQLIYISCIKLSRTRILSACVPNPIHPYFDYGNSNETFMLTKKKKKKKEMKITTGASQALNEHEAC